MRAVGNRFSEQLAAALRRAPDDLAPLLSLLSRDCHVKLGQAPTAIGKAEAEELLCLLFAQFGALGAGYFDLFPVGPHCVVEFDLTPRHGAGGRPSIMAACVCRCAQSSIFDVRLYGVTPSALPRSLPN